LKTKLIYGATFLLAFFAVTGLLIVLNQKYENIFQFNFNEKKSVSTIVKSDSASNNDSLNNQNNIFEQANLLDSLDNQAVDSTIIDSVNIDTYQSALTQKDSVQLKNEKEIPKLQTEIPKVMINSKDNANTRKKTDIKENEKNQSLVDKQQNQLTQMQDGSNLAMEIHPFGKNKSTEKDSAYIKWKKSTVKLYELMDPKKAAKIISQHSDNIARDLIYSMNKKKAAQILQYLDNETVIKLTRIN
jgi:flagellar motility protein MotE (MotC chaperone)